jgi:hypothetical protein
MNRRFLHIAKDLTPKLIKTAVQPVSGEYRKPLCAGESVVFDFGNHYVGYVDFLFSTQGSVPDAPAFIRLKFCETAKEIDEATDNYNGWISRGWIQEEFIHIDNLPGKISLKRRYAFRYVRMDIIAVSSKYRLCVENVSLQAVTSAERKISPFGNTQMEKRIDEISLRTLSECMQTEFEDGPKRDRRLWIGDLRLQALANYATYKQNDLVKRCLYLFAGTVNTEGRISACVFTKPKVLADDTYMFDYSLLFIPTLLDYYNATADLATVRDLFQTAYNQLRISKKYFDENGLIIDSDKLGWCFLDWSLDLNKQAGAQAVYIYCAKAMRALCEVIGESFEELERDIAKKEAVAKAHLFDEKLGLFISGTGRQISFASNVWFVLAGVFDEQGNQRLLQALESADAVKPVTPYMMHHYVDALLSAGMTEKAYSVMMGYWGAMAEDGADTFYELFNPDYRDESPYGSRVINSYCHAWSCTPSYLLRKFYSEGFSL